MSKTRPPFPAAFREQMVELVRSGTYAERSGSGVRTVGLGHSELGGTGRS